MMTGGGSRPRRPHGENNARSSLLHRRVSIARESPHQLEINGLKTKWPAKSRASKAAYANWRRARETHRSRHRRVIAENAGECPSAALAHHNHREAAFSGLDRIKCSAASLGVEMAVSRIARANRRKHRAIRIVAHPAIRGAKATWRR